ncbi:hypothetical protein RhiXN_01508 [Rhizoctonia solani]|uniref:Uncharacterized protein n=1 Tax=Rhizoctonia solani TaxID=456999 RepID=A0A8H8P8U3_9AGAM|nr:uncharacterized protein RhiXN_01508 [Rhizoctonia solani]QRW26913.1 hypothetical protein RhiXN_01508 [Rhizoctonia solani]
MKVTGIISALVFVPLALAQAADPSSAPVSTTPGPTTASSSAYTTQSSTKSGSAPSTSPTATGSVGTDISQDSLTESYSSDSANPFIPASISTTCSDFLTRLNSDATISKCLGSLTTVLSDFTSGPGSASAVPKALDAFCTSNSCVDSKIRPKLTEFKDACSDELIGANPNDLVIKQYDIWYSLIPFKSSICVKGSSEYCLLNIYAGTGSSGTQSTVAVDPTYRMPPAISRAPSASEILSVYSAFGTAVPMLSEQPRARFLAARLNFGRVGEKCPAGFAEEITKMAGIDITGETGGAATMAASYFTTMAAAFAAAIALF